MQVIWTKEAQISFENIVDFLMASWTEKEASSFIDMVETTIFQIKKHPHMFKISEYDRQSREAFITKHTTMFYREIGNSIEIEYFWGNFQHSKKLEQILKP